MKKIIFAALILISAVLLVSCGSDSEKSQLTESTASETEYKRPVFKNHESAVTALDELIDSVPKYYRSIFSESSQEEFNLVKRSISGKYNSLTVDEIADAYISVQKAIAKLEFEYSDVPQIFILSDDIPMDYINCKIYTADISDGTVNYMSDGNAMIKIRGNSSSSAPKKSYNIKFSEKQKFLGMDSGKKWSLIGNAFDKTLMRCSMASDFSQKLRLPYASQARYADIWLNGQYLGSYLVMEPISEGKGRVDIDINQNEFILEKNISREEDGVRYVTTPNLGLRWEINEPAEPNDEQYEYLKKFLGDTEQSLMTLDHKKYEKFIDIDSFVDYYIYYELFKDIDFAEFSTRYFIKDNKLYAGPPWDLDLSMGNVSYCEDKYLLYNNAGGFGTDTDDSTIGYWARRDWYEKLCADDYFLSLVQKRYDSLQDEIVNLYSENKLGESYIDRTLSRFGDDFRRNYSDAGWDITAAYSPYERQNPENDYDFHVNLLRRWLEKRNTWLNENIWKR